MDAIRTQRFVPPHPPRTDGPVPVWRGFVGERARTAVYGWSEQAFERSLHSPQGVRLHRPHPARSGHDPAGAARQCRQLCEAGHRQEAARPDDRARPAELGRGACGATSGGSSPPISRRPRSTPLVPAFARGAPAAARLAGGRRATWPPRRPRRRCGSSPTPCSPATRA